MPQTWSSSSGDNVTCSECGSVYSVTLHRFPMRDKDSFNCQVCGNLIDEWNDTEVPNYKLIKRKDSEKE